MFVSFLLPAQFFVRTFSGKNMLLKRFSKKLRILNWDIFCEVCPNSSKQPQLEISARQLRRRETDNFPRALGIEHRRTCVSKSLLCFWQIASALGIASRDL